jgi:3',5'-nucleoside bisphosphate phosphatase
MIDLHTHSTCSDGSEPPARVVELASSAGCSAVALTDHDTLEGISVARSRADQLGIRLVTGCEVSSTRAGTPLHLLCYFFGDPGTTFGRLLERVRDDRTARNVKLSSRLEELGVRHPLAEATAEAKGSVVGRPHFASVLVRQGLAASISDAFDRFLKKDAIAYVPRASLPPEEVIAAAGASGGVVALAHPFLSDLPRQQLDGLLVQLSREGLVGLESYYAAYSVEQRQKLVELADRHGLVPTGGSDFHGSYRPSTGVGVGAGDLAVPDEVLDALMERAP